MEAEFSKKWKKIFLVINCLILAVGNCGGPLVMRLYFLKGGKRIWFTSWLQTAAFPIILIPLLVLFFSRKKTDGPTTELIVMKYRVFIATAVIGILTGVDNYLYSSGVARLPVSTSALLMAPQLAFTAFFAFFLVKQKFTAYSVNAVVLLTLGAGILALNAGGDKPEGESNKMYVMGFIMTLAAAALYGLILPMVELMYLKGKQKITYTLVLEIQLVMCFFATVFCTVGMIINNDFQVILREAQAYRLGEVRYYTVVIWSAILFQFYFLGVIGVVFCASSLFSGIMIAVLLPVTQVLAVICFHESFQAQKGVSLVLSLWGFVSYFYGEFKQSKKAKIQDQDTEAPETELVPHAVP